MLLDDDSLFRGEGVADDEEMTARLNGGHHPQDVRLVNADA